MILQTLFSAILLTSFSISDNTSTIKNGDIELTIAYGTSASVTSLVVNGQKVVSSRDGMFTTVKIGDSTYSSLRLSETPSMTETPQGITISGILYGGRDVSIRETWSFIKTGKTIQWKVERSFSKPITVDEASVPVINFDSYKTWEGAYQGYGGLAWFYLFNERLCTYGVHSRSNSFWNSKSGNGLTITVTAPGKKVAMKYTRSNDDRLNYSITVSAKEMIPRYDSGTNRRRFIRKATNVWSPFAVDLSKSTHTLTFTSFRFEEKYGRGKMAGINGEQVSAVLNTIARIGVIDSLHFGGNSWHTPYGPICLHEQYIAEMGLGINDPNYISGYQSCLDFYRDHAIKGDGRIFPRWAYTNEDAMAKEFNQSGFYEAQWGYLLDSQPDFVANVADLYNMTGDKAWVKKHRVSCEKVLDWILARDQNNNGLVEMMTDDQSQKRGSDWIDIIWASYENAFVNAKLYNALVKWSAIERQLNNTPKASAYEDVAAKLKANFNKSVADGGFWDDKNNCYVHWHTKDNTPHGRNMVIPVNFMAIAYGICDDGVRKKIILDAIEEQMIKEKLFFWPLTMSSYAAGEGNDWQFPFPNYENGDLFLSWGSIGVKAYADYNPAIAVKYVRNVLEQYGKDGLAFQRYGRKNQEGLGDDILSGNSLAIVGLYQSIYGVNPMYNRLYLSPHITSELAGTELKYRYRKQQLTIRLDSNMYSISNSKFKVIQSKPFGYFATEDQLSFFQQQDSVACIEVFSTANLTLDVKEFAAEKAAWDQTVTSTTTLLLYHLYRLKPGTRYQIAGAAKAVQEVVADANGELTFQVPAFSLQQKISVTRKLK